MFIAVNAPESLAVNLEYKRKIVPEATELTDHKKALIT